jgi:hypothetical protein
VPNLITDRGFGMTVGAASFNVRRLMYQALIWSRILGDDARRLSAPLDAEYLQGLANPLVDRVRRDAELGGDLLRIEMLVDEAQAIELAGRQARDALGDRIFHVLSRSLLIAAMQGVRILRAKPHLAQHGATPRATSPLRHYAIRDDSAMFSADFRERR